MRGSVGADPGDQLDERPAALVGVGEVAVGVPACAIVALQYLDVKILHVRQCLDVKILDRAARLAGMRDEVDELVEAWARERADLDLGAGRGVQPDQPAGPPPRPGPPRRRSPRTGSSPGSSTCSPRCAAPGAPYELSPGRLLRETLVTSGTMTNRVDRLAARGFVERYPDPDDRRGVLVRLTAEGKTRRRRRVRGAARRRGRRCSPTCPPSDQKRLAACSAPLLAPFA